MYWLHLFSQFDITIHHVPGKSNVVANALSHFMDRGVIVESAAPVDFFSNPKHDRTKEFLSQVL